MLRKLVDKKSEKTKETTEFTVGFRTAYNSRYKLLKQRISLALYLFMVDNKGSDIMIRKKSIKEIESIHNIIRLLILEAGIALLILYISLRYGEQSSFLGLIAPLIIAVVNIFIAIKLWKYRDKKWLCWIATILSILILFVLSVVDKVIFPLIIPEFCQLGVALVIICVNTGIIIWTIGFIKQIKKNNAVMLKLL